MEKTEDSMRNEIVKGAIVSTIVYTGSQAVIHTAKHPFVLFSVGMLTGFLAHKYRKEIISEATKTIDVSKDFVKKQRHNLEELIAN